VQREQCYGEGGLKEEKKKWKGGLKEEKKKWKGDKEDQSVFLLICVWRKHKEIHKILLLKERGE
jgi:hypothetical protein